MAVAVKVPYRHGDWTRADEGILRGLERAVTMAQQDAHGALKSGGGPLVDHDQVEKAVAVQVCHRHKVWTATNGIVLGGLERAVARSKQGADGVRAGVDHG